MLQINTWSRHSVCIIFACIPATSYQLYTKHESQTLLPLTFPCANFLRFKRSNFLCRLLSSFNVSLQWFKSHGSISLKSLITFIDSDFIKGCQCDLAFFCSAGKIFGSIFFRFWATKLTKYSLLQHNKVCSAIWKFESNMQFPSRVNKLGIIFTKLAGEISSNIIFNSWK